MVLENMGVAWESSPLGNYEKQESRNHLAQEQESRFRKNPEIHRLPTIVQRHRRKCPFLLLRAAKEYFAATADLPVAIYG